MARDWDKEWLEEAIWKGQKRSKDRSRKVGAVIVNERNVEVATGWNGFPRGINDDVDERHMRPAKYLWTEHAERNAIYNAAAEGRATKGCKIYSALYPCSGCAGAIIQSGIREVITIEPDWDDPTYKEDWEVSREKMEEAGVIVRFIEGDHLQRKD